ncbi:B12-binding domain-containing radical SAM protein [Streptomyces sp. NPDC092359]|uniref:B12-binding domain-containing radical SAM protein n=1 Tax=Streptomyces sp. NPDC092359 TaxID=3366014 RepID=UPI0037F21CE8
MSTVSVPERQAFWRNFDIQYRSTHAELRPMKRVMWELPHWMHWLGGVLETHGYTSMDVLDLYTEPGAVGVAGSVDDSVVRAALREHPGDVYLFSPMTVNLPIALQIAHAVKDAFPRSVTVFGGIAATPLRRIVAADPSVDYVVTDRGEIALPALLDALRGPGEPDAVGHLTYRDRDGIVRSTGLRYPDLPVAELPFPKVDLFPRSTGEDLRYLRQVYALGCPYKCSFCTIQTIGRKAEYFAIDRVLAEIHAYRERYGEHHHLYWGDETFTLHPEHTLELLSALEAEGDIAYDCQTRLNCLGDPKVLRGLKASGCRWIEIGLETAGQDSHHLHKHHMKLDPTEETLKKIRDEGLAACAFTVNGFPEQTPDQMRRSVEWVCGLIEKDLLQASYLFGLVPYPGSALYQAPEQYGMKLLHHEYGLYHEDMPPVYETPHAKPDEIYEVFLEGVEWLGEAMGKRPHFGEPPAEEELGSYGNFWDGAHV